MRIGIDIDNTICKTSFMANEIYKRENNGKSMYDLNKWEQYKFTGLHEKEVFDECPLEDNAVNVINELFLNNEIFFITARANKLVDNIEKRTKDYLNKHGIKYNGVYFGHDSKLKLFEKLNLDIMLDDDYDVYYELTSSGYKVVIYSGSLNLDKEGFRVNNWLEFKDYIERIQNYE